MSTNKKISEAIHELEKAINNAPKKIAKCANLADYMSSVRAPINLRLIDLALGIQVSIKNNGKKRIRLTKCLKDEQLVKVCRMVDQFILQVETPFLQTLDCGDDGIPLVTGLELPDKPKKSKKGVIELIFKGTKTSSPLCQQLLTSAAIQELAVFGKKFHKTILRNRILIGLGVIFALIGLAFFTYFIVIRPRQERKAAEDVESDYCSPLDIDPMEMEAVDLESGPVVALA